MAEAPTSAPRRSKTYNQFVGMNSQDGRYGDEDNELFYLENIMRTADGKLSSVSGPSAILATYPADIGEGLLLLEDLAFLLLETGGKIKLE